MKIGLTYTYSEKKHQNYVKWLENHGEIEVIKLDVMDNNLDQLANCDGLVMSGGRDIHPKFYKSKKLDYREAKDFDENRDQFEISAFKLAQEKQIPVLGICRGMQLINCILGGNLKQDLGKALNKIHRFETNDKAHGLNIESNTTISKALQVERCVVNSAHHQAIKKIGKGLKANCKSDDGIIEGIEWDDPSGKSFLLAVQWHPERMFGFHLENSPVAKAIRERFIEEIKKSIANKK